MASKQKASPWGDDTEPIKQHPGPVQVTRAVKVEAPGKHFSGLSASEAKVS